jgi:histidinol-phosphate aminotransferase
MGLQLNRYPDPFHYNVKEKFAKLRKVKKEQIFFGVGSDEAIDMLFRIFCNPRVDNVLIAPPTYGTRIPLSIHISFIYDIV